MVSSTRTTLRLRLRDVAKSRGDMLRTQPVALTWIGVLDGEVGVSPSAGRFGDCVPVREFRECSSDLASSGLLCHCGYAMLAA